MSWQKTGMALAAAVFVFFAYMAVTSVRSLNPAQTPVEKPAPQKAFSTDIAENFRLQGFASAGVDFVSFGSCRIEKLRRGAIAFGAFNVLVVDDVVINLMPADAAPDGQKTERSTDLLADTFTRGKFGLADKKFSSVRINRLTVNRWTPENGVEKIFSATSANGGLAAGGNNLRLEGCVVFENAPESGTPARDAVLIFKPEPLLVYQAGNARNMLRLNLENR